TVKHDGKDVEVVAEAGKTGFLYVLDRKTGKPIWPIEERKVPQTDVKGEQSWPTQPFPTAPPPFVRQSFSVDDINPNLPAEQRALIKDQLLSWRNEGLFTPPTLRGTVQTPGDQGGSNWGTTAADPTNGMVFVLGVNAPAVIRLAESAPGIPAPTDAFGRAPGGGRGASGGGGRGASGGGGRAGAGAGRGAAAQSVAGRTVFTENCQICHGADLKGVTAPSLVDINSKMDMDAVRVIVTGGKDAMPSFSSKLSQIDIGDLMAYLANPAAAAAGGGRGGRGGRGGATADDNVTVGGTVVAVGPAPASVEGAQGGRGQGGAARYGGNGGSAP